jgi:hypothetical protein
MDKKSNMLILTLAAICVVVIICLVEDVSGAYVDPYHYEVNFLPDMIIPVTFTMED